MAWVTCENLIDIESFTGLDMKRNLKGTGSSTQFFIHYREVFIIIIIVIENCTSRFSYISVHLHCIYLILMKSGFLCYVLE